jgi:fumarate reductase flavoprotein subunit
MNSGDISEAVRLMFDVVVIGGGGGLAAAIAAAEQGAKVLLLEKRKTAGGNTALARGLLAAESPVQKRMKIDARKEDLFNIAMSYSHWKINPRIIRALIDRSGDTIEWLEQMGVKFVDVPHFFNNQVPRMYHIPDGYGAELVKVLVKKCEDLGVHMLYETAAKRIWTDERGNITGVLAETRDKKITIGAKSVVIATGGYSGNKELLKKYFPNYTEDLHLNGLPNMGDGLNMAIEIGAATEGLGIVQIIGPFFPGAVSVHVVAVESNTIWVNRKGMRFADEAAVLASETANALNRQPDKISYSLFDEKIKRGFIEEGLIKGIHRSFPSTTKMVGLELHLQKEVESGRAKISHSWEEMAKWIGADFRILKNTIEEYNASCDQGYDDQFYKDRRYLQPLRTPPFYGLKCCQAFHGTIGGIKINYHMEVLNRQDNPIPGLFAAGSDAGGWESDTYCYILSGTAFAFAINSGRMAGENAAKYTSKNKKK